MLGSRLASVAAVAAGAFAVAFAAALAVSAVRGGRGMPELRLLADGALAVVLGGWVGVAVGRLSGSRMVSVLAAPVWVAGCLLAGAWPAFFAGEPALAVQRLAPLLAFNSTTERSAEFGFLPDPLWPHLGYLLGLVLLVGVGLLTLAARGSGQRPPAAPLLAAVLAGVVLVTAGGVGVVTLPHRLVVLGPDRADWRPLSEVTAESGDRPWTYPDDGHARACAGDATLTACVYPAYGQGLAQRRPRRRRPGGRCCSRGCRVSPPGSGWCRPRTPAPATAPAAAARPSSGSRRRERSAGTTATAGSTTSTSTCAARSASATGASASTTTRATSRPARPWMPSSYGRCRPAAT